jgi:hypothetical protein
MPASTGSFHPSVRGALLHRGIEAPTRGSRAEAARKHTLDKILRRMFHGSKHRVLRVWKSSSSASGWSSRATPRSCSGECRPGEHGSAARRMVEHTLSTWRIPILSLDHPQCTRRESRAASMAGREVVMDRAASSVEWTTRRHPLGRLSTIDTIRARNNKHNNSRNKSRNRSDRPSTCARRI